MGTDIHIKIRVRVKNKETGLKQWQTWDGTIHPDADNRHYRLFGVLAGVRGDTGGEGMASEFTHGLPPHKPKDEEWFMDHSIYHFTPYQFVIAARRLRVQDAVLALRWISLVLENLGEELPRLRPKDICITIGFDS